jgi:uncharacterized membrane protein YdjX (TVP38/TMEM64 family)
VFEAVQNPVAYFFAMIVVFSVASLPPSPPTLMAARANAPWLLASLAAVAAAIAAVLDYYLVRRAFRVGVLDRVRRHPLFERVERWAKVAPFFTVALFAAVPLPFMIPRVLVPLSGYPVARYAAAVGLGRWPRVFVIATFGTFVDIPVWMLKALFAAGVAVALIGAVLRRLGWIGGPRAPQIHREPPEAAKPEPPPPPAR